MASGRSIRFKISTLLVIPLVSLVALWGFAASTTSGEALNLLKVETIWTGVINNADRLVSELQTERLASAERLAGTGGDEDTIAQARAKVDEAGKLLRQAAMSEDTQSALTQDMKTQLGTVFETIDRLPEIRRKLDERRLTSSTLVTEYARISDEIHLLYSRLTVSTDLQLALQAQGLIAADQARELLSRENALVIASKGKASMMDVHILAGIDGARTYEFPKALANLDTELRAPFEKLYYSSRYVTMENLLEAYINGQPMDLDLWRGISEQVQREYREAISRTGDKLLSRMEPAGVAVVTRAAVAGALGLIAVVFSIVISVKVGRRLTRELGALRRTALDLAEIRLPDVVTKLRKGGTRWTSRPRRRRSRSARRRPARSGTSRRRSTACRAPRWTPRSSRPGCARASPRRCATSPGAASRCCSASSGCWTTCSARRRSRRRWSGCSGSTTSPPACAATPRAWCCCRAARRAAGGAASSRWRTCSAAPPPRSRSTRGSASTRCPSAACRARRWRT
ncbi:nitrate- and nitrite sensing domain-containing protein [Nonomuraea salmonea]|uniref:nitrate- and nitrite sensing domain-containing protein n=1 Tax=Nonomuraea salmonea TaxID=46181 RepID=UPI002FED164C